MSTTPSYEKIPLNKSSTVESPPPSPSLFGRWKQIVVISAVVGVGLVSHGGILLSSSSTIDTPVASNLVRKGVGNARGCSFDNAIKLPDSALMGPWPPTVGTSGPSRAFDAKGCVITCHITRAKQQIGNFNYDIDCYKQAGQSTEFWFVTNEAKDDSYHYYKDMYDDGWHQLSIHRVFDFKPFEVKAIYRCGGEH